MWDRKKLCVLGILFAALGICVVVGRYAFQELEEWASYDPKEAAYNRLQHTLNAAYENPTTSSHQQIVSSCGGLWLTEECWVLLQDEVKRSSNEYNMKVIFYNWEDEERPTRGGDEIIIEIDFASGNVVSVYTYESCIDYCSYK